MKVQFDSHKRNSVFALERSNREICKYW